MSAMGSKPIDEVAESAPTSGRLFFLDLGAGRICCCGAYPNIVSAIREMMEQGQKGEEQ